MIFTVRRYAKRGIYRRRVSVCVSVTLQYCIKMGKRRITQIMPHDRVFNLNVSPPTGVTNAGGVG